MSATVTLDRETVAFIAASSDVSPEALMESLRWRINSSRPMGDQILVTVEGGDWCHAITQHGDRCSLWAGGEVAKGYSPENRYCTRHAEIFTRDATRWLTDVARPREVDQFVEKYLSGHSRIAPGPEVRDTLDRLVGERIQSVWGAA